MIKVTIGNNVKREAIIIDKNTTLRAALEDNGVDYTRGVMHLDGSSRPGQDLRRLQHHGEVLPAQRGQGRQRLSVPP